MAKDNYTSRFQFLATTLYLCHYFTFRIGYSFFTEKCTLFDSLCIYVQKSFFFVDMQAVRLIVKYRPAIIYMRS